MLAINSGKYQTPVRMKDADGETVWKLVPVSGMELDYMVAYTFNYTWTDGEWRATFHYEGGSVKPSPRTLRVYGAEVLRDVVLALATHEADDYDIDFTILFADHRSNAYEKWSEMKAIASWSD